MNISDLPNTSGVYKIIFPNNKIYIGISNKIRNRILEHLRKDYKEYPELPISRAINKYGINNVEVLELIDDDREVLIERERYWIRYFNATDKTIGYNVSVGGDGAGSGINNHEALLNQQELDEIVNLLINSDLSYAEIGAKYNNLGRWILQRINLGISYYNNKLDYPLRKKRVVKYGLENKQDAFYGRELELNNLVNDLQNSNLDFASLKNKYNIKTTTLTLINQGKKYYNPDLVYPLRKKNAIRKRLFSNQELDFIKSNIENGISLQDIAKVLQCDRKVISDIARGRRQRQEDWQYPIIKLKPVSTISESGE